MRSTRSDAAVEPALSADRRAGYPVMMRVCMPVDRIEPIAVDGRGLRASGVLPGDPGGHAAAKCNGALPAAPINRAELGQACGRR